MESWMLLFLLRRQKQQMKLLKSDQKKTQQDKAEITDKNVSLWNDWGWLHTGDDEWARAFQTILPGSWMGNSEGESKFFEFTTAK